MSSSTIVDDNYSERWKLSNKLSLSVSTPFYLGNLRAFIDLIDYESNDGQSVDFNSVNYAIGLSHRIGFTRFLAIDGGVNFGIQKIAKDIPNVTSDSIERELFYAFLLEPGIRTKYILFYGSFEYRKIYNFERQNLYFLGAGIRVRLFTPDKIRNFID
ncbi:MAG: hypothetical protein RLN81_01845 [Balneolaceae bacterium]